jgi:ATP-binding cassette, subfamily C, type I secretion system permease/ATPase
MPLYLGICFLFHPWIGIAATIGALILVGLAFLTEARTRKHVKEASGFGAQRMVLAEASRRNAEVLAAMGMAGQLGMLWREANAKYMASHQRAADVAGGLGALSKVFRMLLQSGVLGLGAYLVINQQATAGIIIASSILTSRALAPVELAIANWKGFVAARQSWDRLKELLGTLPAEQESMALPAPMASLSVEGVAAMPPGTNKVVVQDVAFRLKAGNGLGIIGPSASGKSSLARMLVGVWTPIRGKIRLDGAALEQWSPEARGRHIGYLPQDVELFAGTVVQNIARFDPNPDPKAILAAAQDANVHQLILRLPDGYKTQVGEGGQALSAGQRQRIALARALYGEPFLIVLDEPNSNLDAEGEQALTEAVLGIRARGGIAIVIAHRPSALAGVEHVLVMAEGKAQWFGPKDEVLKLSPAGPAVVRAPAAAITPLRAVHQGRESTP